MRLFCLILACLVLPLTGHAAAPAKPAKPVQVTAVEGITEYRLANGLQVLLVPDDGKPTTTVNMTVRVGSRQENYGESGMAHLLEHLMFKGTPKYPLPWGELNRRGFQFNGTTSWDRTNYFASFAVNDDNQRWYLGWLADALVNSFIAKKDLDTEMTVVRNEMERGENNPGRILLEKTMATMYQWHNYGKSTIGARSDVENVDIARLQAFYRTYYRPDNTTLIVSGKFNAVQTLRWVQDSFGKLARPANALRRTYTLDAVQDGERSITLRRVGGTPMVLAGYHVPPAAHPDYPAVDLLTTVLADAPAGRLHKALVDSGRAAAVFGYAVDLAEPGAVFLGAQFGPGQDVDAASKDALAVIEGLAASGITEEEFRRAQAKWLKAWEQQFTDPEAVGVALSDSIAQGDWRLFFLLRDRVKALTLADLQRVAAERFVPSNRTLGTYLPTDKPLRAPAPAAVDLAAQLSGFKPQAAAERVPAFDTSPANLDARTQRATLRGGLKAALLSKPTRGQAVQAEMRLHFGDEKSLQGRQAEAAMVAALLDKGTKGLSRQQIQDRLDALKTEMAIHGDAEGLSVSLSTRREHIVDAVKLVSQLLREPSFPQPAFEEVQRQQRARWADRRTDPQGLVAVALSRAGNPYPKGDPRHERDFADLEADAAALTPERVRAFHAEFFGAANAEFSAVGDFDAAALRQTLEAEFGNWAARAPYQRVPRPLYERARERAVIITPDKQNAVLGVVQSVPLSDRDSDYAAFMLANFLLGGSSDSRLWNRIREREGLSYGVGSSVSWNARESHSVWQLSAIFAPANRDKVERAFKEEVDRALKDGFGAAEVTAGKQALLSQRRLSRAQDDNLAAALASQMELGRTFAVTQKVDEEIAALTLEQVNAALRKYLKPAAFATVLGGDFKP